LLKKTGHFGKNSEEAGGKIDIKHKERGDFVLALSLM